MTAKVNIVMLVRNRRLLTAQALESLDDNTDKSLYNLTVVDDGSEIPITNAYHPAHRSIGDNATVLRIEHGSKGITGQARNLGVYWAERYWGRGEYLYLSDNDMYFTPGWLEKLIAAVSYADWKVGLIGGWNHPYLQPKPAPTVFSFTDFKVCAHDAVAGASQLMSWHIWYQFGPLDAHAPGVGQSEDWKFSQSIIQSGGLVGSIYPRVVFNCGVTNSLGAASTGADEMVRELVEAKKTYEDLYWN